MEIVLTFAGTPDGQVFAALLEEGIEMRGLIILLLLAVGACGKQANSKGQQAHKAAAASVPDVAAAQSMLTRKPAAEMQLIAIPEDKAQLNRLLAMGYTIHEDHMHPPGVKECPFDKAAGGVVE